MARFPNLLLLLVVSACFCVAQNANDTSTGQSSAQTPAASSSTSAAAPSADRPHGPMPIELTKSLDSKKLKEGDPVTARLLAEVHTRDGGTIPRNSTMTGHVTQSQARSKGDPQSTLGIVFDKIVPPGGKDLAVKGVIVAVAPSAAPTQQAAAVSGPGMMAGHEGGGPGTTPPPLPSAGSTSGGESKVLLNGQSKGVVGIRNLQLGENSVFTSTGKEVKLDSGTQMIVQVEIQVPVE